MDEKRTKSKGGQVVSASVMKCLESQVQVVGAVPRADEVTRFAELKTSARVDKRRACIIKRECTSERERGLGSSESAQEFRLQKHAEV